MYIKKDQVIRQVVANPRGGPGEMVRLDWTEVLPPHVSMLTTIVLEPGCGIGHHVHDTNTEVFYILAGTLEIDDNGETHIATPGDIFLTGGGDGHSVMNNSTEAASMVAIIIDD